MEAPDTDGITSDVLKRHGVKHPIDVVILELCRLLAMSDVEAYEEVQPRRLPTEVSKHTCLPCIVARIIPLKSVCLPVVIPGLFVKLTGGTPYSVRLAMTIASMRCCCTITKRTSAPALPATYYSPATYYYPLRTPTRYLLLPATCRLQLKNTGDMVPTINWSLYRDAFRARLGSTWKMVRDEQVLHHSLNMSYLSTTYSLLPTGPGYNKGARLRLCAAQLGLNPEARD